jgi:hypothetical protein
MKEVVGSVLAAQRLRRQSLRSNDADPHKPIPHIT